MNTFYKLGEKYAFPPLFFYPLSITFFPNLLFGHIFAPPPPPPGGWSNRKTYTPDFVSIVPMAYIQTGIMKNAENVDTAVMVTDKS